ncbi:MAG: S-adenosylmethionine synthase [Candidatus Pacebacteria bacterium GW2011_GWF2_38_9]|nr:MAG: S-adenosylmethionine synthetase, S-adenosylmethionine synthetase [candidate division TM6 bacterium GW2011_GWF2_28_16]KKQ07552.1 MAG: S-adenosylmethionine synthase [Candidatus Pacebacteria bacterium GW2011_GWF1_36_5]KKQ88603.1 MAG: S-adenosylmethionine synthase [Candidatus Pacebacteria bacterium GW2011_GWF2_38_9]HAZ73489.1 methionine adenosyltransferase [Candidatus Paceibacterota bacterium]
MFDQFTSESVAAGHPDKICDQISDSIIDACLAADPKSRVAVETLVTTNKVVLAGEVTCSTQIDFAKIARQTIKRLGYVNPDWGFSDQSDIEVYIHEQSPDIAVGVDDGGAGDQGIMFGYACNETPELMPMPIMMAHQLMRSLDKARETNLISYLRPDGKAQVVIDYDKKGQPQKVSTIIMAVPYDPKISKKQLDNDLWEKIIVPAVKKYLPKQVLIKDDIKLIINGTGAWEIGGPASDTGVTGRKIIVDTYGGMGRHGGGCFSGKDPSKVDRSAAYACRFLAKNIVAHGLASRCELRVGYVIGQAQPVSFNVETFSTGKVSEQEIKEYALSLLDMSVKNIIKKLDLRKPVFAKTAAYGHFGREEFSWEKIV